MVYLPHGQNVWSLSVGPRGPTGEKGDKGVGEMGDVGPPGAPGNVPHYIL